MLTNKEHLFLQKCMFKFINSTTKKSNTTMKPVSNIFFFFKTAYNFTKHFLFNLQVSAVFTILQ